MWIRQEKGGRYMAFRSEGLRRGLPKKDEVRQVATRTASHTSLIVVRPKWRTQHKMWFLVVSILEICCWFRAVLKNACFGIHLVGVTVPSSGFVFVLFCFNLK